MFKTIAIALGVAVALALPRPVRGAEVQWLHGTSLASEPALAGTVLAQTITPFSFTSELLRYHQAPRLRRGDVSGSLRSRVVRADDGTLDFYWRVLVDWEALFGVVQFNVNGFGGVALRGAFRTDLGGNVAPELWVSDGSAQSFIFRSEWSNAVWPGQTSVEFFLDTDATDYARTASMAVSSDDDTMRWWSRGTSAEFTTFAPLRAVPEPQTWAFMMLGLAGLVRRFRGRVAGVGVG